MALDPLSLGLSAGGAALSGVMSLIGYFASQGDREKANQLLEEAYQQYGDVVFDELPNVAPQLLGPSQMSQVQTDPRLREAQLKSLGSLEDIGASGGLLAQDKAVLNRLNQEASADESGRQARILENMRARGVGSSGAELAAQLSSAQASAQRGQQRALDTAGMAQRRALDAIMGAGQLGGGIRGQDFGEASARARAADEISRYNADTGNRFALYDQDRRRYNNQLKGDTAARRLAASQGQAGVYGNRAGQTQQVYSGFGSALGAGMGAGAQYAQGNASYEDWLKKQGR